MAAGDGSPRRSSTIRSGRSGTAAWSTRDPDAEEVRAHAGAAAPRLNSEQELAAVLSAYGAKRMVVGHTPDLKGIEILYGGRLARIDTGIRAPTAAR